MIVHADSCALLKCDMQKIVAVVPARMNSSRLPGKSMIPLLERPSLSWLLERLRRSLFLGEIVVATTWRSDDGPIVSLCDSMGIACFRGDEEDVLGRVLGAAKSCSADVIVQVTGDCPLVDPAIVDLMVEFYFASECDYVKNFPFGEESHVLKKLPQGMEVEVFSCAALESVALRTKDPWLREHVTEPLYTWREYSFQNFPVAEELHRPEYRLCIDTHEDLTVIQEIFCYFGLEVENVSLAQVICFLDEHPTVAAQNLKVSQKKYSVGVAGLGNIGMEYDEMYQSTFPQTYCKALSRYAKTRLLAACEPKESQRKRFLELYPHTPVYSSLEELVGASSPEILCIATPVRSHFENIMDSLGKGVGGIICEKPFVLTSAEGLKALSAVKESNVLLAVNYWPRYCNFYQALRRFVGSQEFGKISTVRYHYTKGVSNSGSYAFDFCRQFFGEIDRVERSEVQPLDIDDPNVAGYITMASGLTIALSTSDYRQEFYTEILLESEKYRIEIKDVRGRKIRCWYREPKGWELCRELPFQYTNNSPMLSLLENFVGAFEGRETLLCSGEDGLEAVKWVEEIRDS
ncbi:MAG: Gfo/Idh/MocA family oxidoreductase [Bdellovibrionales bacterium]|nr:Gfo/Idh/MocA family oxidoreductase [Bdellovibrionales bacterium]